MSDNDSSTRSGHQTILPYATVAPGTVEMEPTRAGEYLVVGPKTFLPERCVFCNQPGDGGGEWLVLQAQTSMEISWKLEVTHNLPEVAVHACYCRLHARHLKGHNWRIILCCLLALGGGAWVGWQGEELGGSLRGIVLLGAAICILAAFIDYFHLQRRLVLHHQKDGCAYLTGAGKAFLDSLPRR